MMNGPHCMDMVSHPRDVARFVVECAEARIGVALVFVTAVEGGSMREPGLRMAASITGATAGYVSNGCVEADLVAQARKAIVENRPAAVQYGRGSGRIDMVLPCGGGIELLICPVADHHLPALRAMIEAERETGMIALATDGSLRWDHGMQSVSPGTAAYMVRPKIPLLIVGSGVEALALAHLASGADMQVELVSPDDITLTRARDAGIPVRELRGLSSPVDLRIDGGTAIALMFHDHEWEQMVLLKALDTDAFYVGALGSRRAHARRVEGLIASGCSNEGIARIKAPIGLVHRLRDPHLIAASVIAEIAAAFQERFTAF